MSTSAACLQAPETFVGVESDPDAGVALLTVSGPWDRGLWLAASAALATCLAEHPGALIVDLTGLDDSRSESAQTWRDARRDAAGLSPAVQLALCVPPDLPLADRLQQDARPHLPVYARVRQARVAVTGRIPADDGMVSLLRPEAEAPSMARNLAADACLAWGLTSLLHPARLVMSELVTNAVEHAGTEMTVAAHRRGHGLRLSVSDESPKLPVLVQPARPRRGQPLDERGRGLRTVAGTAAAWGSVPTRTGKIVWAMLRPAP